MKDNYVILDEIAYEDGSYETIINTHLGVFSGHTEPDSIDAKYLSIYHASEIALAKALRKFAESAINTLKREIKLLNGLIKQSVDMADDKYDIDNTSFRLLNGTLKQKQKDLSHWEARVQGLTNTIKRRIAARDKIVAKYYQEDNKNEN